MSSQSTSSSNHFPVPKLCQKFTIKEFKLWEKNFKVACVSRECYEILTGVEVAPVDPRDENPEAPYSEVRNFTTDSVSYSRRKNMLYVLMHQACESECSIIIQNVKDITGTAPTPVYPLFTPYSFLPPQYTPIKKE